jgi:hypothetical protein
MDDYTTSTSDVWKNANTEWAYYDTHKKIWHMHASKEECNALCAFIASLQGTTIAPVGPDFVSQVRAIVDPGDKKHLNLEGLLWEVTKLKTEHGEWYKQGLENATAWDDLHDKYADALDQIALLADMWNSRVFDGERVAREFLTLVNYNPDIPELDQDGP